MLLEMLFHLNDKLLKTMLLRPCPTLTYTDLLMNLPTIKETKLLTMEVWLPRLWPAKANSCPLLWRSTWISTELEFLKKEVSIATVTARLTTLSAELLTVKMFHMHTTPAIPDSCIHRDPTPYTVMLSTRVKRYTRTYVAPVKQLTVDLKMISSS